MAYSYVEYVGDGSTKTFNIPFTYLDQADIKVYVGAVETPVTFTSASVVTLATAPASGVTVRVKRITEADARLVDFQDGSTLTEELLDLDSNQTFFLVQESMDRSDEILDKAQEVIDAKDLAKQYAEWAYKYERLAFNHMEDASDFKDQAQIFKELAESSSEQTKTAAVTTENARAEVATNRGLVETAKNDVLIAKGLVEAQASLASVILTNAQGAAAEAQSVAGDALATATTVQGIATELETTIATVASQQAAALAAKTAAEAARDASVTAKTSSEAAATTATTQAGVATTKATEAATSASTATTQAGIATTKAGEAVTSATSANTAKTAAEAARDAAQGYAASIDVSNKADVTYVNNQLALKANTSSLASVALSGSYADLINKPSLFSGSYADLTGKPSLFSGSYADLTGKPTIPTVPTTVSSFTNDSGYINGSALTPYLEVTTAASTYQPISGMTNYVTLAGSQVLTNKTFTGYTETVYNLTGTDINPANGTIQYKTLTANTTLTESLADGQGVTVLLNPATYTVTWPTTTWIGSTASTAPTLVASVYNCITFFQIAGVLYGKYEGRV